MWINMFFLLFVVVIPNSTALLGRYIDNHFAILVYGANLIFVGLSLQTLWTYATTGRRLVDASLEAQTIRWGTVRRMAVPVIGALCMAVTGREHPDRNDVLRPVARVLQLARKVDIILVNESTRSEVPLKPSLLRSCGYLAGSRRAVG
ncbi:MAG: hypothetical protein PVSMB1_13620 [Gemmatimonadaceae bacterium]